MCDTDNYRPIQTLTDTGNWMFGPYQSVFVRKSLFQKGGK